MTRRLKLFTSLSTLAATGALALSACGGEGEGEGEGAEGEGLASAYGTEGEGAESEGAESEGEGAESEGEGAESEGEGGGDPATDNAEYIYQLGLVQGHLIAFRELHAAGEIDMAATHAKHPESELYAALAPAFAARSKPGFADELNALVRTGEEGGNMDSAYAAIIAAIEAHIPDADVKTYLLAASKIAATAAEEFDIGVEDDGVISNAHEYQDAYGFLASARNIVSMAQADTVNESEAVGVAQEQIETALAAFDGLAAASTDGAPSTLYGAAARIEIAALGLS